MYRHLESRLAQQMRKFLRQKYGVELERIVIEQPPKVDLGEYALPLAFELAKKLRKAPRKIAEEIVAGIGRIEGFEGLEVAGAGYINARVDRAAFAAAVTRDQRPPGENPPGKILVEHSSINPNKAAHIGHLRNAILGDTFVRLLRFAGREVDVQNYIDNTGVQVADVVVGFLHLEKKSRSEIEELARQPRFDYYCWNLYARVSQWYEQGGENKKIRLTTLHEIEQGGNDTAAVAELISTAVLRRHLETMDRLDIEYDFLPRESEILRLHFWDAAFTKLKDAGVLFFETEGKNRGCWVMRRAGTGKSFTTEDTEGTEDDLYDVLMNIGATEGIGSPVSEQDQKVIVRSNGTVGYVGKDIAYHMWKFGLLGRDFSYRKFFRYPNAHDCWVSTTSDDPHAEKQHPHFGDVVESYNVIDVRQAEAQNTVIDALGGLGHGETATRLTHFSYGMVVLSPRCAAELGYELTEEEKSQPWIGVSGRKGFGVKADDLMDKLIASAHHEVESRHPELEDSERKEVAEQIAIGALRYFMLKYTKSSVIVFDFEDALSFEGETGPYAQYAVVRATNIFRKGGLEADKFSPEEADFDRFLAAQPVSMEERSTAAQPVLEAEHAAVEERPIKDRVVQIPLPDASLKGPLSHAKDEASHSNDQKTVFGGETSHGDNKSSTNGLWELWLAASKTAYVVDQCIATTEPAYLAKHVFQLAQIFNTFYHRYPILTESDEERKKFLLATAAVARRELIRALGVLGIEVPVVM